MFWRKKIGVESEYVFLSAGKFLPRMEKLAGKLFHARHKFFSLQDTLSQLLASYKFGLFDANFARFCFILPLQISLIFWPIGRPPAERPGIPKGRSPLGHNVTTFKILQKKGNYRGSPTYAVFTSADPTILVFGLFKVHISWEGHKILQNLHLTFVLCSASQK